MAGITLAQAETALANALAAHAKVCASQEYKISDRSKKNAMLSEIDESIKFWDSKVKTLTTGGRQIRRAIPI